MFVGMPGLSPVPELATFLFQLCKRSGGISLTKAGKIFAKRSFCHTDLEHGSYKRNYVWSCATHLLHDSSAVSPPTPPPLKICDHLETLFSFSLMKEDCSQSSVHPTLWNVRGFRLSFQNTSCYGRKELPDIKPPNKKYLWVWRKGNGWEINNFLLISFSIYRSHLMKGFPGSGLFICGRPTKCTWVADKNKGVHLQQPQISHGKRSIIKNQLSNKEVRIAKDTHNH